MKQKKGHPKKSSQNSFGLNNTLSDLEVVGQFKEDILSAGIKPPSQIVADGLIHRFSSNGKPADKAGWYILYTDGRPSGSFGDYRLGLKHNWSLSGEKIPTMSAKEALEFKQRVARQKAETLEQLNLKYSAVAAEVWDLWKTAPEATANHPYLVSKGIGPHIAKQLDSDLWIPLYDTSGKLWTIQSIGVNGFKMLWKGGKKAGNFCLLNKRLFELDTMEMAYMAEGFATASSVAERYPEAPVFCAIDSGNLLKVTANIKKRWPYLAITIISDNDRKAESEGKKNIGVVSAKAVANQFANVFVEIPNFPKDAPLELSDFNDLVQYHKASMGGVIDE